MVHLVRHALEPRLRSGAESRFLLRVDGQLQLGPREDIRVDVIAFERAADAALLDGEVAALRSALAIHAGELLPGDVFADWLTQRRQRLSSLRQQLGITLAEASLERGELAAAIAEARALLAIDTVDEAAHRLLMRAFASTGARAQALQQFALCRQLLQQELAAEPDAATRSLHDRIAAGDAASGSSAERARPPGSVAVMPFASVTGDDRLEYLGDGLCESLIRALARCQALRVMAASTVLRYRRRDLDPRAIGRELGVATAVIGRIERHGDNLAITVELVRTVDGSLLWGNRFDGTIADVLVVEHAITSSVRARLDTTTVGGTVLPSTRSPIAFEHYLRGRHEWNKRTAESIQAAIASFEAAIDADPGHALAHAGLADCHHLLPLYASTPPHEAMPRARRAAQQALELDPALAEAHTSLAYVQFSYDWDLVRAEASFRRALELSPGYATAHQWMHELLTAAGRFTEQSQAIERARQLDPLSPIIATEVGWGLYYARDAQAACGHMERTVATFPRFPVAWLVLGLARLLGGDRDAALTALEHARAMMRSPPPLLLGAIGYARAGAGRTAEALACNAEIVALQGDSPAGSFAQGLVFVGLRDFRAAEDCFLRAFAGRVDRMVYWLVDPLLDEVRHRARLAVVVKALS